MRKDEIAGLAVASEERIEAYLLYIKDALEIVSMRSLVDDSGARLKQLLSHVRARGMETADFPKVHAAEIPSARLEALGFRVTGAHVQYVTRARSA